MGTSLTELTSHAQVSLDGIFQKLLLAWSTLDPRSIMGLECPLVCRSLWKTTTVLVDPVVSFGSVVDSTQDGCLIWENSQSLPLCIRPSLPPIKLLFPATNNQWTSRGTLSQTKCYARIDMCHCLLTFVRVHWNRLACIHTHTWTWTYIHPIFQHTQINK